MTFAAPKIIKSLLTNGAYGYPSGAKRKHDPDVLAVIHVTGNPKTAKSNNTKGEIAFMNRPVEAGGHYNSAHSYIDRNGVVYSCVPLDFPAWNNGDLLKPDLDNAGVRKLVDGAKRGINANELCYREIECTGYPGSFPVTDAQIEAIAFLVARDSIKTGLPINRNTVLTHADINSVNRPNCAFMPAQREKRMQQVIDRARAIKAEMKASDPDPAEDPPPPVDPCQAAKDELEAATGRADDLAGQLALAAPKAAKYDQIVAITTAPDVVPTTDEGDQP